MRALRTPELPIREIPPFGNIDLGIPVSRFLRMGFRPGDAVDVGFSNGFAFRNIPVFSGFYGAGHMPCLYAASKFYPNVGIGCPVSGNPWHMAGLHPDDTAHVALRRRRGFDQLEGRMQLPPLLGPALARTPQQNANWRNLDAGTIAPETFFRSCSPIRGDSPAAASACELMQDTGIRSVLNLSDNPALCQARRKEGGAYIAPYLRLCDEGRVLPLHLGVDYRLQGNARTLAHGLLWLAGQPKPALIHCKLGMDRTGMVCALLEMLMGAHYAEIEHDYRLSYLNLFGPPPRHGQGYPLCDLRFKEVLDFFLSFVRETQDRENASLTHANDAPAAGAEDDAARTGIDAPEKPRSPLSDTRRHPDSETLQQAARAYLAFGGLDEGQIDRIARMLAGEPAIEGSPR